MALAADAAKAPASALDWAEYGAAATLIGALLSGPVSLLLVNGTHPQPPWRGTSSFVQNYHAVQTLPFFFGFVLAAGFVALIAGLSALGGEALRARSNAALCLCSAFAALVFANYMLQTTFVPLRVQNYPGDDALLGAVTMSNPDSLGWCLEMWAYAALGVATWLVAPVFAGGPLERATRWAFVVNGPLSLGSALATAILPGWVLTRPGLVAFFAWNLLVVAMAAFTLVALRRRRSVCASRP
jgi:hypothetical protein